MKSLFATVLLASPVLAAGAVSDLSHGPQPIKAAEWAHEFDYPSDLPGTDRQAARLLLAIDTHGNVRRCDILESGGSRPHDARACAVLLQRGRFKSAADRDGKAIPSTVALSVDWRKPFAEGGPFAPPVDFVIDVARLPDDRTVASVSVRQILNDQGALESCEIEAPSGLPAIDKQACSMADPLLKLGPVIGLGDKPMRAMRVSRIVISRAS